eukprot:403718_1
MIIWWLFCLTLQIEKSIHHFEIVNNAQNRTFPKWQSLSNVTKLSIKMQPHHTTCKNNWVNNINRILIAPNNLSFSQNQYISDKIPITQQTQHEMNQYHFPYNRRYFNNSNNIYTKSTLRFDSVYKFHFNDSHVSTNYPILPHDTDMNYMDKISTLESSQFIDPKEFICTTRATNTNNNTYTYTQYIICSSKSVTYVFRIYKHSKNVVVNAQNVYGFEIYMRPYIQVNHIIENIGNKYRHYKLATTNAHKQPVTSILLALTWQPKVLINLFLLGSFFAFMVCRRSEKHQSIARIARNVFTFDEWYTITIKTLLFLFISFSTSTESIIYATILMTGSLYLFKNGKHSSIKLLLSSLCITMVYATEYSTVDPTVKQSIDSNSPTLIPTSNPSIQQTTYPTFNPTSIPSILPTAYPTFNPSLYPSIYPTRISTLAEKSLFLRNEGCDFGYCTSSTTIDYEHVCVNQLHVIGDAAATQCCPTQSPTNNPTQSPTKHTNTPTFSPLTGPVSPIVGVISCGETKYGTLNNNQDLHYYQLTTNGLNDITYTTCESSFDTMLKVYNYQAEDISSTYCIGPIGNYELILDHKDIANGYFSTNLKTTGLENENDPTANTYSIIGNINPVDYLQSDGKYHLKLIFRYSDGSEDILTWKQSSWITDSIITGADLSTIPTQTACSNCDFEGLGLSTESRTYLDGDGSKHSYWYQSVGQNTAFTMDSTYDHEYIPAFNEKMAFSESLFVLSVASSTTNAPALNPVTRRRLLQFPAQYNISDSPSTFFYTSMSPTLQHTSDPTFHNTFTPSQYNVSSTVYNATKYHRNHSNISAVTSTIQPTRSFYTSIIPTTNPTNMPTNNPTERPTTSPTTVPTIYPTPYCPVLVISVINAVGFDPNDFNDMYVLNENKIKFGRMVWEIPQNPDQNIYSIGTGWIIHGKGNDQLSYADTGYFPDLNTTWFHITSPGQFNVQIKCINSFFPTHSPSLSPTTAPSNFCNNNANTQCFYQDINPSNIAHSISTIQIRSTIDNGADINYFAIFNIKDNDCVTPKITVYFRDTDFDSPSVEYLRIYYQSFQLAECGSESHTQCNVFKYCLDEYSVAGINTILQGTQFVLRVLKGSGVNDYCSPTYSLWADISLSCTQIPTQSPSQTPTSYTHFPTKYPTQVPTLYPTQSPTLSPTITPSNLPTVTTVYPTQYPTITPTLDPTLQPTLPTLYPTIDPTNSPSESPTEYPSTAPSFVPSENPTQYTIPPSAFPTVNPTMNPTLSPTDAPTISPTNSPSISPSMTPTLSPTVTHTYKPTCKTIEYGWNCFLGIGGFPNQQGCRNHGYNGDGIFDIGIGKWDFPYPLNFSDKHVVIRGQGQELTTWNYIGNNSKWIQCTGRDCWLSLQNLTIRSTRNNTQDSQFYMVEGGTLFVRNVIFDGTNYVQSNNYPFWTFMNRNVTATFEDCYFLNNDVIYQFLNGTHVLFKNCVFSGNNITKREIVESNNLNAMFHINSAI